jgi:hypothetical protein
MAKMIDKILKGSVFKEDDSPACWRRYVNRKIAEQISAFTRYYDQLIQWLPRDDDAGLIFNGICAPQKRVIREGEIFPDLSGETESRTAVLLNGNINHHYDIQGLLMELKNSLSRTSRVILIVYNPYFAWLYRAANWIGIRKGEMPTTFVTRSTLQNIATLAGYAIVRTRLSVYSPWKLWGLGDLINGLFFIVPGLRWLSLAYIAVLRPIIPEPEKPSLSCIIPARNESGNIENALKRIPDLGCRLEIIFVEGNSTDDTWSEIIRVKEQYGTAFEIKTFKQTGKGKADAVRLGFSKASGDLLTILDADLTMPPELLGRFYKAYIDGYGDFINGSRLVYPMEGEAMKFLNRLGNIFFARALSWGLDMKIGDSLCGTKLVARHDYRRMIKWREDFGEFDPFGDFELLFPAAVLGLGCVDIPIRYLERTYGSTNISRFKHGLILLRMTLIGFYRIKLMRGHGRYR